MTEEEFMRRFLEFEFQSKMFKVKINGVRIWHYIRYTVYYELLGKYVNEKKYILPNPRGKKVQSETIWDKLWRENVKCSQFRAHQRDVLIIPHQRKYKDYEDYYKCIYTSLLDQHLTNSHYILSGKSMENEYAKQDSENILYLNIGAFLKVKRIKLKSVSVSKTEVERLVINPLEKFFNIMIDKKLKKQIATLIINSLHGRQIWINYYNYMLQKIKPKIILLVVAYSVDNMILCEVARKRKIPTVELQHGRIDDLHAAYNFYRKMDLPSFPNYIFTFGQLEKKSAKFPIDDANIIPIGYPELEKNYNLYCKKTKKEKKVILFISPGGDTAVAKYAFSIAQQLNEKKYHIIFKLHPQEYYDWKLSIGMYLNHPNIEVVGNYEQTIYYFLAKADWIVGSFSTALFEAQMFDAKTAIIKEGSYHVSKILYDNGCALLVDSPEKLTKEIEEDLFQPNKEIKFFEKNSLENMQRGIDSIIAKYSG